MTNVYHDGTTAEVSIEGYGLVRGLQSISWAYSRDAQKVAGSGQKHIGITPGMQSVDNASIEMLVSDYENIVDALGGGNPTVLMNQQFDITVTERVPGRPLRTTKLTDCSLANVAHDVTAGDSTPLTVSMDLIVMGIDHSSNSWFTVTVDFGV